MADKFDEMAIALVTEQSEGEWTDELIRKDAAKLAAALRSADSAGYARGVADADASVQCLSYTDDPSPHEYDAGHKAGFRWAQNEALKGIRALTTSTDGASK